MAKMPTFFLFDDFDLGVVELIHQRISQITLLAGEFPHKPIETEESTCSWSSCPNHGERSRFVWPRCPRCPRVTGFLLVKPREKSEVVSAADI
jgi:hypothetical protein